MEDNHAVLDNFGKGLMQYSRDRSLGLASKILQGKMKSPNQRIVGETLQNLTPEERKAVEDLAKLLFNKMFFEFEQFLNAHPEYKLVYSDGESELDLLELSDGLFGEMFGDDGWIEKYSEFDGKDYF